MKIHILCSDAAHPVNAWLTQWCDEHSTQNEVAIFRKAVDLPGGDFLFLVSCHEIIRKPHRERYRYTLVIHASDLPKGRGMSPHIWQILEGANEIKVTLLNAEDALDSGDIWHQEIVRFEGGELYDKINAAIFDAELSLMTWAIENCDQAKPVPQTGEASFYRKRTPQDSRIDEKKSLESQFALLRVADPDRYPAFFELGNRRYKITITRVDE